MKKICIAASSNKDKIAEIKAILQHFSFEVISAAEAGEVLDVAETADSFAGNARLKAESYHKLYPEAWILADDSGLCVDGLDGRPGIYSARYGGRASDYVYKSKLLWTELRERNIPEEEWTARFVCAVCWFEPGNDEPKIFEGRIEGLIIPERRGEHGFGYDPIFYLPEYGKTTAEIDPELKNKISHRGRALEALRHYLHEDIVTG